MSPPADLLPQIEALIRCDPARRGILSANGAASHLGVGQLAAAARHLAEHGREVAIVTGFAVSTANGPVAETDGPPGAVLLAKICAGLGMRVQVLTDEVCGGCLRAAAEFAGLPPGTVVTCPIDAADGAAWCDRFLSQHPRLTHLIAVERVGPSHTEESYRRTEATHVTQKGDVTRVTGKTEVTRVAEKHDVIRVTERVFVQSVPLEHHDRCFNMRGEPIDALTAPLHRLFERLPATTPSARSIGIGDGGNEIGMGAFAWDELHPLISGDHGPRIVCRIATDWTVLAGTSNWGASALAAALAMHARRTDLLRGWTSSRYAALLNHIVVHGPAVDGVTREPQPSVDGLPFATYIRPWIGIRAALELGEE